MKVALEANSTEDEHDCFSDDTHHTLFFNGKSIRNIYLGEYKRIDGSVVKGPSLADLVAKADAAANDTLKADLADTGPSCRPSSTAPRRMACTSTR